MEAQHIPAQTLDAYCAGVPALLAVFVFAWFGFEIQKALLGVVLAAVSGLAISEIILHSHKSCKNSAWQKQDGH